MPDEKQHPEHPEHPEHPPKPAPVPVAFDAPPPTDENGGPNGP